MDLVLRILVYVRSKLEWKTIHKVIRRTGLLCTVRLVKHERHFFSEVQNFAPNVLVLGLKKDCQLPTFIKDWLLVRSFPRYNIPYIFLWCNENCIESGQKYNTIVDDVIEESCVGRLMGGLKVLYRHLSINELAIENYNPFVKYSKISNVVPIQDMYLRLDAAGKIFDTAIWGSDSSVSFNAHQLPEYLHELPLSKPQISLLLQMTRIVLKTGIFQKLDITISYSGETFWYQILLSRRSDILVDCGIQNITVASGTLKQMAFNRYQTQNILTALTDILFMVNDDFEFIDCFTSNPALYYTPKEQFLGKTIDVVLDKALASQLILAFQKIRMGDSVQFLRYQMNNQGIIQDYEAQVSMIHQRLYLIFVRDISAQVQIDKAKTYSENLLKAVYNQSTDAIFLFDALTEHPRDCNERALEIFETTSKAILLSHFNRYLSMIRTHGKVVFKNQRDTSVTKFEILLDTINGVPFWADIAFARLDISPEPLIMIRINDISKRKEAENAVEKSEIRFRTLVENSSDIIIVLDQDCIILFVSPSIEKVLGYHNDNLKGNSFVDLLISAEQSIFREQYLHFINTDAKQIEFNVQAAHIDGHIVSLDCIAANHLTNKDLQNIVLNIRDVTERKIAEKAMLEQQYRLEIAKQVANMGLWEYNFVTKTAVRDSGILNILELEAEENFDFISFWEDRVHPKDMASWNQAFWDHVHGNTHIFRAEYRVFMRTGKWKWVLNVGKIINRNDKDQPERMIGVIIDINDMKFYEAQHHRRHVDIYDAIIQGQDLERKRIAAELHDGLGQQLHALKMYFNMIYVQLKEQQGDLKELLSEYGAMLNDAIVEMRNISHNLMPRALEDLGLVSALESLCNKLNTAGKIQVILEILDYSQNLEAATEATIYRIVQEAVNNTIKHANAQNFIIQICRIENSISIILEDDGIGFEYDPEITHKGIGIANIEARVQLLGGNLLIDTHPGKGTTLLIEFPLADN